MATMAAAGGSSPGGMGADISGPHTIACPQEDSHTIVYKRTHRFFLFFGTSF